MTQSKADFEFDLAMRSHREGRLSEAEQLYRQILARQPDRAEALHALGALLDGLGRPREAVQFISQSISRAPNVPEAHYHLARALKKTGELNQAIQAYKEAVRLQPQFAEAWNNLGVALKDANQIDEAMRAYRHAIALRPNDIEPRFNLGNALALTGNAGEAIELYRAVLAIHPDAADVLAALGNALRDCGQLHATMDCYRRSVSIHPDPLVGSNLAYTTYLLPSASPAEILNEHVRWDQTYARPLAAEIAPHPNDRSPHRPLRVGFVSHDLSLHPVGRFILPLFENLNRETLKIVCYADGPTDEMTDRLKNNVEQWRSTSGTSDAQLAELIRHDSIDVLVDLSMHTKGNRLLTFARKPAPIQVAYLAYCGTTGLGTMDYRLTDPFLDPPGSGDEYSTERSVRLAQTYWCYQPLDNLPEVGPSPAMSAGHLTIGSLNSFAKVTEPAIEAWGRILRAIPLSRLVVQSPIGPHRQRVTDLLKALGVDSDRVEFLNRLGMAEYFKLYQRIDLTLDSFPCSGATTTCDSLWMGVPAITLTGVTAMARSGTSILANAGFKELIAGDVDDYIRIATDLLNDLPRLANLRASLRQRMAASPLMNTRQFATDFEQALRQMWRDWCAGGSAMSGPDVFMQAVQLHRAGRLGEAQTLYERVLATDPHHAQALHMLGLVAHQSGRHEQAADLIRRAIAIDPRTAAFQTNLGSVLASQGQFEQAADSFRHSIALDPNSPESHNNLGNVLKEAENYAEAVDAYRRAIALRPIYPEAWYNLAGALHKSGQLDQAIETYQRALQLRPPYPDALNNLGTVLCERGRYEESTVAFRKAIALKPDFAEAWSNLGNTLKDSGLIDDALAALRRALSLRPDSAEIHNNLGNLLRQMDQLDESIAHLREALRLRPDFPEALSTLGGVYKDSGQITEAIEYLRKSLAVRPIPQAANNLLFSLHHDSNYDARRLFEEHQKWNQQFARPLAIHVRDHDNDPAPQRRIRVGYVSPDLSDHPVGRFLLPLLQNHDHSQVEVICYTDTPRPDAITQSLRSCSDAWHSTLGMSDPEVAASVRRDRIDILVDLAMHTRHNRLLMFARKPAPVQATYLAYSGTTGLETMDYRLSDPYLDPPGVDETTYVEKTIRLPHTFWCYQGPVQAPDVGPLPAVAHGYVTFGSFNQFAKVSSEVLAAWIQLLRAVPGSRLKLHAAEGAHRRRTLDQFAAAGLDVARIEFVGRVSSSQYFAQYNTIDMALDTFPYPGGTTTCDALWMGVPVVCLPGGTSISRGGLSVLSNVGLPELAAGNVAEYVALAAKLSTDLDGLSTLRASMRDRMRASPLMDAVSFARDVEAAYRTMWRAWCQKLK